MMTMQDDLNERNRVYLIASSEDESSPEKKYEEPTKVVAHPKKSSYSA